MSDLTALRKNIFERRQSLATAECEKSSMMACYHLLSKNILHDQQHIALYHAIGGEIDPIKLMTLLPTVTFYLPILHPKGLPQLWFGRFTQSTSLVRNRFGILEPDWRTTDLRMPWELDNVIVPLVAFDNNANRIGMGAGFYDRTFAFRRESWRRKPLLIGLAYEWQRQENINPAPWDVRLDLIITD